MMVWMAWRHLRSEAGADEDAPRGLRPLVEALLCCGGIRIEDNVRVTAAEPENFTRDAFAAEEAEPGR